MVPADMREAVARGLRVAFGVDEFDDIAPLTGGRTASPVFRVIVSGSAYVLKIITRDEDPTRHYDSMRSAAEAGIAPRVCYTDTTNRVSITDFVTAEPQAIADALIRMPALLRRLHALPPFARAPFNTTCTFLLAKGRGLDGFLHTVQSAKLLPPDVSDEFFARYAELAAVYPYNDREMVSSHNDLFKPDNILFDGRRAWLVDWEAAFLNDRYGDLAAVANQLVMSEDDEVRYLRAYFGVDPSPYQRARLYLMQQISHLFYTVAFLYGSKKPADWSVPVPEFREHHRRLWLGEVDLGDPDVMNLFARVHWGQLVRSVRDQRYREALRIVSSAEAAP